MMRVFRVARAAPVAVTLVLVVACGDRSAGGGGSGDAVVASKVTLRYHPPAGAVHRYTLDQLNKMSMVEGPLAGMGEQNLTLKMRFTQSVTGAVAGGIEVRVTLDSTHMEAPGVSPEMMVRELDRLRGLVSTVLLDERAQVVRSTTGAAPGVAPELASQVSTNVKAIAFPLPEQPVGQGDSWTVMTDLPMAQLAGASGAGSARTTRTVREIRVAQGDTSVVLAVETTFPRDPITLRIGGQPATLKLSGGQSGEQVFSLTRGVVVSGTMKGTMRMNVTGGPVGPKGMVLSSATETTLRLIDAP